MSNKTAEGLRDRLFDALDRFIKKEITTKDIEGVCYLSEQILKTSRIELDFKQELNEQIRLDRAFKLKLKREENTALELLQITMKEVEANV